MRLGRVLQHPAIFVSGAGKVCNKIATVPPEKRSGVAYYDHSGRFCRF